MYNPTLEDAKASIANANEFRQHLSDSILKEITGGKTEGEVPMDEWFRYYNQFYGRAKAEIFPMMSALQKGWRAIGVDVKMNMQDYSLVVYGMIG